MLVIFERWLVLKTRLGTEVSISIPAPVNRDIIKWSYTYLQFEDVSFSTTLTQLQCIRPLHGEFSVACMILLYPCIA